MALEDDSGAPYRINALAPAKVAKGACTRFGDMVNYITVSAHHVLWPKDDMDPEWNDSQPIYRQLRDRVVAMILDGLLLEGDPLPSVRNVAADNRVNPLTVLKGYQQLVDEQLVEKRRGRGLYINVGARELLLRAERQKFLSEQWPAIRATIQRLGLTPDELMAPETSGETGGEG